MSYWLGGFRHNISPPEPIFLDFVIASLDFGKDSITIELIELTSWTFLMPYEGQ